MAPIVHTIFSAPIVFDAAGLGGSGLAVAAATFYIVYAIFATRGNRQCEKDREAEK
jgi:hypothetical protein